MDAFTDITYSVENGLAWITINRPDKHNALAGGVLDALATAVHAAGAAPGTRLVAIRVRATGFLQRGEIWSSWHRFGRRMKSMPWQTAREQPSTQCVNARCL